MVDVTTVLIGIVFFIVLLIIIVYFVYYNRTLAPTSIVTDNGISLTSAIDTNLLITDTNTIVSNSLGQPVQRNVLGLSIASGGLPSGSQGWILLTSPGGVEIAGFTTGPTGMDTSGSRTITSVPSGTRVIMQAAYTGGYVSYNSTDSLVYSDTLVRDNATPFILNFNVTGGTMSLQSTIDSTKYLIPINMSEITGGITMGVPSGNSNQWIVNLKPSTPSII